MKNKLKKYLPTLLCFGFIVWMIVNADLEQKNLIIDIGESVPWGDKIGHFVLFGTLALLLNMALGFRQVNIRGRRFHWGSVLVFAFAALEEISQLAFPSRTFDLMDMLFDLLGIGVLSSVAFRRYLLKKLREFTTYLSQRFGVE